MMKRVVALILCLATVLLCLTACAKSEDDKGAYIRMYLNEPVYDVDPLNAFDNEATLQIVSMLFEGLFTADENGKPQKALVNSYDYIKDEEKGEYILSLSLKQTNWSDGVQLTATDAQYAFRRLLFTDTSHPAAVLLYDIKNARSIAEGNDTVDHLGVTVVDNLTLEIEFEKDIDVDKFLLSLCSPALYPLRDDIVDTDSNWSKKAGVVCSGPFILRSMDYKYKDGFILERNGYYYRDRTKDDVDEYVTPYRIVVNYMTDDVAAQLKTLNSKEAGSLYYFSSIPFSARSNDEYASLLKDVKVSNAPSTHVYYLNQNALINGEALFAKTEVRKALSMVIDREAIAKAVVYAIAADALVPYTLRNRPDRKVEFREKAESYISTAPQVDEAKKLLSDAGIKAGSYSFSITVAARDAEHVAMANLVKAAWSTLGFNVTVNALDVVENVDLVVDAKDPEKINQVPNGTYSDPWRTALQTGSFEVIALDLVATSPDAFMYLAPFATQFSGMAINMTDYSLTPHVTGYNDAEYNEKIEAAFAAEKAKDRAALLHEAEAMLLEDMPVIPIVYNQNATLKGKGLSGMETSFFCNSVFTEIKLSGYWKIAIRDGFVVEDDGSGEEEVSE